MTVTATTTENKIITFENITSIENETESQIIFLYRDTEDDEDETETLLKSDYTSINVQF